MSSLTLDYNVSCSSIVKFCMSVDKTMDYIPFLSAFNNAIDLVAKLGIQILKNTFPDAYRAIKDHPLVIHWEKKHALTCVLLAIPFLNFILANVYHSPSHGLPSSRTNMYSTVNNSNLNFDKNDPIEITIEKLRLQSAANTEKTRRECEEKRLKARQKMEVDKLIRNEKYEKQLQELRKKMETFPEGSPKREMYENLYQKIQSTIRSSAESLEGIAKSCGL